MSKDQDRSPEAALAYFAAVTHAAEIVADVEKMSPEELTAALRTEGVTPEMEREMDARIDAKIASLPVTEEERPRTPVVDLAARRRTWAGLGSMVAAVAAVVMLVQPWKPVGFVDTTAGASTSVEVHGPQYQRWKAYESCMRHDYADCYARLERARRMDPAGDAAPAVGEARRLALQGLRETVPNP